MIELALIPIIGILGVMAGGMWGMKLPARIALSVIFSYISLAPFDIPVYIYVVYAVLLWGGMTPGHGQPIGQIIQEKLVGWKRMRQRYTKGGIYGELERWQPERLRFRPYLSLALRGLLHLNPAMIVSLPLGAYLALKTPLFGFMDNRWRWWEAYKYMIAYIILIIITVAQK